MLNLRATDRTAPSQMALQVKRLKDHTTNKSARKQTHELPNEARGSEFSLGKRSLAISGYDPVAYF